MSTYKRRSRTTPARNDVEPAKFDRKGAHSSDFFKYRRNNEIAKSVFKCVAESRYSRKRNTQRIPPIPLLGM